MHQMVSSIPGGGLAEQQDASQPDSLVQQLQQSRPCSELVLQGASLRTIVVVPCDCMAHVHRLLHCVMPNPTTASCLNATEHHIIFECSLYSVSGVSCSCAARVSYAGNFNVHVFHSWLRDVLPDVPTHLPANSSTGSCLFKQSQLGTMLGCWYSDGQAKLVW